MGFGLPLIVILGATGSGKTKLSLELAKKFGGEIIGADSMQVYKGLDIITAKATKEERSIAPHHLIDFLEPNETFTIVEYRNKSLKIIDNLFKQNKLPIIVGGTNYYIEALLWKLLIDSPGNNFNPEPWTAVKNLHVLPSEELHQKLKLLDPDMAKRLHPNNKRKILRSLEILYQNGRRHSELLDEQHRSLGGSQSCGGLRFKNSLIFRLQCEQNVLNDRLDKRVDAMIEQGLLMELMSFHQSYNQREVADYTRGIFQTIGFKEFHSYLMLDDDEKKSEEGKKLFGKAVDDMKLVTRRYARKQNKWTDNRFLGRSDRQVPPMYGLDTTNPDQWSQKVSIPAIEIVEGFINKTTCDYQPLPRIKREQSRANAEDDSYYCDICERIFVGLLQWEVHRKSNRHKRMVERKHKLIKEPLCNKSLS